MATTTNYSWTTPDDTDLVKDGAAAIRTLGSSADTTVKNLNPGTTAGDIDYYTSATAKARIAIGTAGQVLQVNSGATAPEWVTPAGGGKVLQVVMGTTATLTTIASTSFTDTTLTASITPSSASSKVLVLVAQEMTAYRDTGGIGGTIKLFRGATEIWKAGDSYGPAYANAGSQIGTMISAAYLDTPNTTSSTTYKTQGRSNSALNNGSVTFQDDGATSTIILLEIGA